MTVIAALWLAWRGTFQKAAVRTAVMVLVPSAVLITPWLARNALTVGQLTGISTLAGAGMWAGLVDDGLIFGYGLRLTPHFSDMDRVRLDPYTAGSAVEADRRLIGLVWKYTVIHPTEVSRQLLANMLLFWSPVSRTVIMRGFEGRRLELLSLLYFSAIFLLAAAGLYFDRGRSEGRLSLTILALTTLTHAPFYPTVRYRLQIEMFVTPYAAAALYMLVTRFASRR